MEKINIVHHCALPIGLVLRAEFYDLWIQSTDNTDNKIDYKPLDVDKQDNNIMCDTAVVIWQGSASRFGMIIYEILLHET